jgi:antirestriction protein ArdC
MKRDLYSDVTARILQQMEAGVLPWQRAWQSAGSSMPMNAVTDRPYSGVNVLLFWMSASSGYARPRYLTFNQAKAAGGNVRKGEHGTKVYFFQAVDGRRQGERRGQANPDVARIHRFQRRAMRRPARTRS